NLEDLPFQLVAVGVELHQRAAPRQIPDIAVRIQAEHGTAGRPVRELIVLRIIFDGPTIHADDDITPAIELQLVRAAAGLSRAGVSASAAALRAACVASRSFRDLEGNFR